MDFSDELLSFSTKLVFSTDGLTKDLKVYWGNILVFFYAAKYSPQRIRQKEVEFAVRKFKSQEQWLTEFDALNQEDKILTVVLLKLLLHKAELFDQPIAAGSLSLTIGLLTQAVGVEAGALVETKYDESLAALLRHENREKIIVPTSILPLVLDYTLKWIILVVCRLNSVSNGTINLICFGESMIFIGVFIYASYRDRKYNQKLFQKHKALEDFKIDFQLSARKYTWLAFFFSTSIVISEFLDVKDEGGTPADYVFTALVFLVYYFVALVIFQSGRVSEVNLLRQVRSQKNLNDTDSDKIDNAIVDIETTINSRTGRLDAYVLESALFGALAFGGFLQIVSTDYVSFKELDQFSKLVFDVVQNLVMLDIGALQKSLAQLYTKNNLFCLAAIETLLCSGLFIAVIASRLRFSDVADRVKKAVEMAKKYHARDESLGEKENASPAHDPTPERLHSRVHEQIGLSLKALEEIGPISGYMEYFRNAGLIMFLLVLISCSLFVTSFLGWLYVAIGTATWMYFNRQWFTSKSSELTLDLQLNFVGKSYLLLVLSILLVVSGFLLRVSGGLENTTFLIVSGTAGIGLYVFFLIIFVPKFDNRFGEIEKTSNKYYGGKWNTIQLAYGGAALFTIASLNLVAYLAPIYVTGSTILLAALAGLLSVLVGYYCSKKKWLGLLIGVSAFVSGIQIVGGITPFSLGDGANQSLIIPGAALASYFVTIIWRKQFHFFLRSILAIYAILLFILAVPSIYGKLTKETEFSFSVILSSLYQHKTYDVDSMKYWLTLKAPSEIPVGEKHTFLLNKSKGYRGRYGASRGYTFMYDSYTFRLGLTADSLLLKGKTKKDSVRLQKALDVAQERTKILQLFNFKHALLKPELEADILMELKRKPEAIASLKEVINSDADEGIKKSAKKKLKEIEEGKVKEGQ